MNMTYNSLAIHSDGLGPAVRLVTDSLTSEHSRRAYGRALSDFITWYSRQGKPGLSKALVQAYKVKLQGDGLAPSTINQTLCAIRKLAREAADNDLLDQALATGISKISGVKNHGVRAGNWLSREQAQRLLNTPDTTTLKGLRDRAVLAVMLGSGLRRSEVARLNFEHIQQREGRWVIVDLVGKGNRVRSIPIPSWAKAAIDEWSETAGLDRKPDARIFRAVNKGDRLAGQRKVKRGMVASGYLTSQAIADIVAEHSSACGFGVAAHDLRRTFAKLAYKGGSQLDQIQLSLGHASIQTTERYLGTQQDLTDAPCDKLGLRLE